MEAAAVPLRARRAPYLASGWQPYALFLCLPVFWILGMSLFVWPLLAIALSLYLVVRGRVVVPRGFGVWLLFLAWTLASGLQVFGGGRVLAYAWRESMYLAATVAFLYVYNKHEISTRAWVNAVASYWVVIVVGGWLAVAFPHISFRTLAEVLVPNALLGDPFVYANVHARLANMTDILGYEIGRPRTFFSHTNGWGSTVAILAPFALAALRMAASPPVRWGLRVALVLAIAPAILSLNRGMWISVGAGAAYIGLRAIKRRDFRLVIALVTLAVTVVAVIFSTHLGDVIQTRVETKTASVESRMLRNNEALERVRESPVFGYATPLPSETTWDVPSVGTESELFLILFSFGIPGLALFAAWLLFLLWRTRRTRSEAAFWANASLLIALVQAPFYDLTLTLPVLMVVGAIALREIDTRRLPRQPPEAVRSRGAPASPGWTLTGPGTRARAW